MNGIKFYLRGERLVLSMGRSSSCESSPNRLFPLHSPFDAMYASSLDAFIFNICNRFMNPSASLPAEDSDFRMGVDVIGFELSLFPR